MLLFLMGVDLPTIVLISLLLFVFGLLIFWLTKKLLRKVLKDASDRKIKLLSRFSAFILSPIIVIGSLALFIYVSIQTAPRESDEEIVKNHYEMMEEDIREDLRIGMSKTEVVGLFGEADTIQSILVYDMSLPEAKEKYILEITFSNEILFIDAREIGSMISRKQKELNDADILKIADTYHNWRSKEWKKKYKDVPGLCKSANIGEIRKNNYVLTPGRYIDFKKVKEDKKGFDKKMKSLTATLAEQMEKAGKLDKEIKKNLKKIGYEFCNHRLHNCETL